MPLGLSETEAWLPSDGLKFYIDGSLLEGRADSGFYISLPVGKIHKQCLLPVLSCGDLYLGSNIS
jgi:hypothetical protein